MTKQLNDVDAVQTLKTDFAALKHEIGKVIIGQEVIIDQLVISLLSRGHCLLVGVPGLAKTLLIKTLADVLDLSFNRIQFTPDLMPSDISGTEIIEERPGIRQYGAGRRNQPHASENAGGAS